MNDTCVLESGDLEIVQGNNYPPAQWQFLVSMDPDVLFDITGSVFKLTVTWPGGEIEKSSDIDDDLAVDLPTSMVVWNYSSDDSRSLPLGRIARYELERWIGLTQQTMIKAAVAVSTGYNPD